MATLEYVSRCFKRILPNYEFNLFLGYYVGSVPHMLQSAFTCCAEFIGRNIRYIHYWSKWWWHFGIICRWRRKKLSSFLYVIYTGRVSNDKKLIMYGFQNMSRQVSWTKILCYHRFYQGCVKYSINTISTEKGQVLEILPGGKHVSFWNVWYHLIPYFYCLGNQSSQRISNDGMDQLS